MYTENKKIKTFITYIYSILTNDKIDMEMKKKTCLLYIYLSNSLMTRNV